MNARGEDIARIQTAVRMADELAGLCRELLHARRTDARADMIRLREKIDTLVYSRTFAEAVEAVGTEYFYPDKLRVLLYLLERGYASSLADALEMLDKMKG